MPHMSDMGFACVPLKETSEKILELDLNVRICYISAGEMNIGALREQYKSLSFGCFIKKPVTLADLVSRVKAELE